jgi:hypothetical protein
MMSFAAEIAALTIEVGDCLEWQGKMGRGSSAMPNAPQIGKRVDGKSVNLLVTRLVWTAAHGPIPDGKKVYRTCCNNYCVALPHLALGTLADVKKARRAAGMTAHSPSALAALTKGARARSTTKNSIEKAREVRDLVAEGLHDSVISERTGVSRTVVSDIRLGRAWQEQCTGASVFNLRRAA